LRWRSSIPSPRFSLALRSPGALAHRLRGKPGCAYN